MWIIPRLTTLIALFSPVLKYVSEHFLNIHVLCSLSQTTIDNTLLFQAMTNIHPLIVLLPYKPTNFLSVP